jgi:hypothetical protein
VFTGGIIIEPLPTGYPTSSAIASDQQAMDRVFSLLAYHSYEPISLVEGYARRSSRGNIEMLMIGSIQTGAGAWFTPSPNATPEFDPDSPYFAEKRWLVGLRVSPPRLG